jgi:hypothetical protein
MFQQKKDVFNFLCNFFLIFKKKTSQVWRAYNQAVDADGLAVDLPNLECAKSFLILSGD